MAKYCDRMCTSLSVAIAETAMVASPYAPKKSGRLKKLIVTLGHTTVASTIEGGYIKVTSPSFGGVDMYLPFKGGGIATVGVTGGLQFEIDCDLAVTTGTNLVCVVAFDAVPVTPIISLYGVFEG